LKKSEVSYDLFKYLADYKKFSPELIGILSKWGNAELKQSDIDPILADASNMGPDQVSFLGHCKNASGPHKELSSYLVDGVLRQFKFVEKMGNHGWLRSPALEGTISRAVDRYSKYLELFKRYPNRIFVPTIDIDLVWHTHLCSPRRYETAVLSLAGRFINHDDKLGKETLADGLDGTKNLFRVRFGEEYLRCFCWDCEALRSAIEKSEVGSTGEVDYEAISEAVSLDVAYYRAVEIARRKKMPLPARPE
jgi:hypothetical protein